MPNAQLAVWRKRGVISLDSSCELPNEKKLVEASSAPRLRQAARAVGCKAGTAQRAIENDRQNKVESYAKNFITL
jgi:hypothetical protein